MSVTHNGFRREGAAVKRVRHPPLYVVVGEELRTYILEQELHHGDVLPSESALCGEFGVSRGTLREAMRMLEEEGILRRRQGVGTFVASRTPLIHSTLEVNESVTEMIRGKGVTPGSVNTVFETQAARPRIADKLGLPPGSPIVVIKRIRTADNVPVAYTEDYLPANLLRDDFREALTDGSLYEYLEDVLGFELEDSILRIKPLRASVAMAQTLGIKPGALLMSLQQTDSGPGRQPLVYSEEYFVADRFEFMVLRRRRAARK